MPLSILSVVLTDGLPEVSVEVCAQAAQVINAAVNRKEDVDNGVPAPLTAKQAAILHNSLNYTLTDIVLSKQLALEASSHAQ